MYIGKQPYLNDVQGLVNTSLLIERESGIHLSGNLSWHNLQDLLSKLNQETVESGIDLLVGGVAVLLSVCNGDVDQLCVFLLLGCGQDEGWVGGGILGLVFANGWRSQLCSVCCCVLVVSMDRGVE